MTLARAALASLLLLGGCGVTHVFDSEHVTRGDMIDPDALAELVPGTSTRADASSLLGSPTAKATFDDNTWIYIGQVTHSRIAQVPGVLTQKVVVLKFDEKGTLRDIRRLDQKDFKQVAMAGGATPSPGSEASFMQQLLGNVGRFNPLGLQSGSAGPSGNSGAGNSLP